MGRKKIRIHRIEDERSRQVTFTKRKNGLMKKAYELSVLCGCRVALIVITENDRVYQYTNTTMQNFMADYNGGSLYEARSNVDMAKILKQKNEQQNGTAVPATAQDDGSEDDEDSEETNEAGDLSNATTSSQDSRPRGGGTSQISSSRPTSAEQQQQQQQTPNPQPQQMNLTPNDGNLPMDQFAGLGQSTGSGQFAGHGQSTGSGQFAGHGQSTGSGQFAGHGQSTGSGQFSGLGQSTGPGQFSGLGQSTGRGQFSGLGQSTGRGQFSGQGQLVGQGNFSGQGRLNPRSSGVRQPNTPYTSSQGMYDSSQSYQQPMTHVGQGRYPYTGNRTTGPYLDQCSTQNSRYPNTGRYDDTFGWPGDGCTDWRIGRRSNAPAAAGSAAALAAASSAGIADYSAIQPSSDFAQVSGNRISDSMQRHVMPMSSSGADQQDQMLSLQMQGRQQRASASATRYFPYQQPSRNQDQLQHHLNNDIQDIYPPWQSHGPGYAFDRK